MDTISISSKVERSPLDYTSVIAGYDCHGGGPLAEPQFEEDDAMADKAVSPSEGSITAGQMAKLTELIIARLRKSGLPAEPTQHVLENQGVDIVNLFEADLRRRVETHQRFTEPHILERQPFHPQSFLGKGWKIDERVWDRPVRKLDAGKIICRDYLRPGESLVNGEELLIRAKCSGDVLFEAEDCLALWLEEGHITLRWLYDTRGITRLSFWGTIHRSPNGDRGVLWLCRIADGSWCCRHDDWLDKGWSRGNSVATMARK